MGSTIFQAPQYDPRRERRKKIIAVVALVVVCAGGILFFLYRNYAYEKVVDQFFAALQQQNYEVAYGIWLADSDWKSHQERYTRYPFNAFYRDWGPGGEWGLIRGYEVEGSSNSGGTGVVVRVQVNQRSERADLWVEKSDKSLTFSPYQTMQ